jgi:diguanylate cyclase (GGDEF)-like protein
MSVRSGATAAWAFGRRLGGWSTTAGDGEADQALKRHLHWAAPAASAFATLAAAAAVAFRDRPTVFGALAVLLILAMVPLLVGGLARRLLRRLEVAVTEREVFQGELEAACRTTEKLRDLANHDELTGLPNRSLLYDRLSLAITQSHRHASHLALLFLDLDDFKRVNDSFGHGSGDRLLVELAGRVRSSVRAGDTVARFGGDEFVVLLDGVSGAPDAERVAAKVLGAVQAAYRLDGREVSLAASIGVSVYPRDGTSSDELLRSADAAMYCEKRRSTPPGPGAHAQPGAFRVAIGRRGGRSATDDDRTRRGGM